MKLAILSTLLLMQATLCLAQPTLIKCEKYQPNTVFTHHGCDANLNPGNSGPNVTWDYSNMQYTTFTTLAINLAYSDTTYPDANIHQLYFYLNTTDTLNLYHKVDSLYTYDVAFKRQKYPTPDIFYNGRIRTRHNITYLDTTIDSFARKGIGNGRTTIIADAYGTLILPTGTFNNVLRVKIEEELTDTVNTGINSYTYHSITYKWYDTVHTTYLLAKSSLVDGRYPGSLMLETERQLNSTSVEKYHGEYLKFSASHSYNKITLAGNFVPDNTYHISIINNLGQIIEHTDFRANSNKNTVHINQDIPPGVYIVRVCDEHTINTTRVFIQ